jgi:hypothetical protein
MSRAAIASRHQYGKYLHSLLSQYHQAHMFDCNSLTRRCIQEHIDLPVVTMLMPQDADIEIMSLPARHISEQCDWLEWYSLDKLSPLTKILHHHCGWYTMSNVSHVAQSSDAATSLDLSADERMRKA